jgi:general secretion pathway protein G
MTSAKFTAPVLRRGRPRGPRGFTLVELLISVTIAALLVVVAVPGYTTLVERNRVQRAVTDLNDLQMRIAAWRARTGTLPPSLADVGGPAVDPWGEAYRYVDITTYKPSDNSNGIQPRKDGNLKPINTDFDLYSTGPDRRTQASLTSQFGKDDIVRAANGRFFGIASNF